MLRTLCYSLALSVASIGLARADDAKKPDEHAMKPMHALLTKLDTQNHKLMVKSTDGNGKSEDKTLDLASDVKYLNGAGKEAKTDSFKAGDPVCIRQKDGKVTELRRESEAKITKVDAKAGTIQVTMTDENGKTSEKTFRLVEDSEYIDTAGHVAVLDVFQSGDDILLVEADGHIKSMKKADVKQITTSSKDDSSKSKDDTSATKATGK